MARGRTDARGRFRVAVPAGDYMVSARAGMSCSVVDVTVRAGRFIRADVPCDTGIR